MCHCGQRQSLEGQTSQEVPAQKCHLCSVAPMGTRERAGKGQEKDKAGDSGRKGQRKKKGGMDKKKGGKKESPSWGGGMSVGEENGEKAGRMAGEVTTERQKAQRDGEKGHP